MMPACDGKILVVAPQPFYEDRGTPIAIRYVLEALGQAGYEVDLLTFAVGNDIAMPGLRILRVGRFLPIRRVPIGFSLRKLVLDLALTFALFRLLHRRNYRCVHAVEEAVFPALLLGRLRSVPVVYDMQSCMPDQLSGHPVLGLGLIHRWLLRCERWAFERSETVMCSAGLAQYVHKAAPSASVREWTFPGQTSHVDDEEIEARRAEAGISGDAPIILYAGNFAFYQGVMTLVEAIPTVLAQAPDAIFVLVGADGKTMPPDLQRAIARVPRKALRILPRQPRGALPSYLAMADILVSPRAGGDNLPLKVFDYMAAGKPIVATDYPIHRTVLDEDRAVLVEPTADAMADGILRLVQDRAAAERLGSGARDYSNAHFGQVAFQSLVEDVYPAVGDGWQLSAEPKC